MNKVRKQFIAAAVGSVALISVAALVGSNVSSNAALAVGDTPTCTPISPSQNADGSWRLANDCVLPTVTVAGPTTTVTTTVTSSPSVTPTTTPTPTPTPTMGSFPNASNTGVPAGTVLTIVNGNYTVAAGVTASGLDIRGSVVLMSGATLKNSLVRCVNVSDWCMELNGKNTITDTEIGGGANGTTYGPGDAFWSGGSNAGNLFQRVNIHNTQDGGRVDGGTTVVDSWIHAMPTGDQPIPTAHGDGVQVTSGGNITYRHNTVEGGNNDSFFVQFSGAEPIGNITVDNCLLIGVSRNGQMSSYGVSIENKNIAASAVLNVTNNQFAGTFQVGPVNVPAKATATGNTYQSTGQPVPIYRN